MACLFPQDRYRAPGALVRWVNTPYRWQEAHPTKPVPTMLQPCGNCIECRFSTIVRPWTVRGLKELRYHNTSSFLTLTYDDAHLPKNNSLDRRHVKAFMRHLLIKYPDCRYLYCGEYGMKNNRPHYHAIIFGHDFGLRPGISEAHHSDELKNMWTRGFSTVGTVTADSIAYVASYCLKKINGKNAKDHYGDRVPEFIQQSKRAIGARYAEDYKHELLSHASVPHDGYTVPVPRYFRRKWSDAEKEIHQSTLKANPLPEPLLRQSIARMETLALKFGNKLNPKYLAQLEHLRSLERTLSDNSDPLAYSPPIPIQKDPI